LMDRLADKLARSDAERSASDTDRPDEDQIVSAA
jgi:hypothetical protein